MKLSKIVLAFAMIAASASSFATDLATVDLSVALAGGEVTAIAQDSYLAGGYATGAGAYTTNQAAIEQTSTSIGNVAVIDQTLAGANVGNVAYIVQGSATVGTSAFIAQAGATNFALIKQ